MNAMDTGQAVASIIMAAGRGSRMKGYTGNKTILPLVPAATIFEGDTPIVMNLIANLPQGPKALVVNHCKADVMRATESAGANYVEQPVLNGTGGAILAAAAFVDAAKADVVIITMGDVPFVKRETYATLVAGTDKNDLMILGFQPADKKQYGVLEIEDGRVQKITEWKYWRDYPDERQTMLTVCNSGIYAVRRQALANYLPILQSRPQIVQKEVDGQPTDIEEFFFTDLIEFMVADGKPVGYHVADDEFETMGIDDAAALETAQAIYRKLNAS